MSTQDSSSWAYATVAQSHIGQLLGHNQAVLEEVASRLVDDVKAGRSLFVAGSGHSSLFALELYHRAGGASFVIPIVAEYLMPQTGPGVVRVMERRPESALPSFRQAGVRSGEMIWIMSQSGINGTAVEWALEAKKAGLFVVAFTSVVHSKSVDSRHPSGQRLCEVADRVVDLGGRVGDALVPLSRGNDSVWAGPVSLLGATFLGHTLLVEVCARLEAAGVPCVYTSVNTPAGERMNLALEKQAGLRDPRLSDIR